MRTRKHPLTPLAAVAKGLLAGVIGTASMDTARYAMYRRAGGTDGPLAWEFAPVDSWEQAPYPGQLGERLIEGLTQRELPDRWAFPISTIAHWSDGSAWASLYGALVGSLRRPNPLYGVPFGACGLGPDHIFLLAAGLYKPIWEYDAKTLAKDLGGHLAYGAGTGAAFWLLVNI